jgi:hypothetical protein
MRLSEREAATQKDERASSQPLTSEQRAQQEEEEKDGERSDDAVTEGVGQTANRGPRVQHR